VALSQEQLIQPLWGVKLPTKVEKNSQPLSPRGKIGKKISSGTLPLNVEHFEKLPKTPLHVHENEWRRLMHSPASHYECLKLELPRAWEPSDSS
jgi:hypothetical protein